MPAGQVVTRLQRQRADKRKSTSTLSNPPLKKLKGTFCQIENSRGFQESESSTSVIASTSKYGCVINSSEENYSGPCLNSVPSLGSLAATSAGSSTSSGNCDTSSSTSSSTTNEEEVLLFGNKLLDSQSNNLSNLSAFDTLKRLPLPYSKQNPTNVSFLYNLSFVLHLKAF